MDVLSVNNYQKKGIKYLTFSNQDGKRWSVPTKNIRVAMELYEPSSIKGKLLKKLLPVTTKLGVAKSILYGAYTSLEMSERLKQVLVNCFGEKWEYAVFWGTPCTDQKITIQIYREKEILGYCKIGNSERVKELFKHEKEVLEFLQQNDMQHVPRCLALKQIYDECWAFVQSTEKKVGKSTEHAYGEKHRRFLDDLWKNTKTNVVFEKTDYYASLRYLEEHIDLICENYRSIIRDTLAKVKEYYSGREVEWGICHRDFTPWNTCLVNCNLFVFDFEYALFNAPKYLDRWHYFVQGKLFEEKYSIQQIAKSYLQLSTTEKDEITFKSYILDIISLYLSRNSQEDIESANSKAKLLYLINKGY